DNYDFDLPRELIRQEPPAERSDCRLMILEKDSVKHTDFKAIVDWLEPGDIIILNRTRVRKSLVYGNKITGGKIEITFLNKTDEGFLCLIKGRVRDGSRVQLGGREFTVSSGSNGLRLIRGNIDWDFIEGIGHLPLPPYVKKKSDFQYYQNEIGDISGSVAAPTASLHFSREMLANLEKKGVAVRYVLLNVGYGTFKEIRDESIRSHIVDEEEIEVDDSLVSSLEAAKGKIVAVGTTVVRSLETAAYPGRMVPYRGLTRIFIYPGWKFNSPITHLLTNFHIPRSSLLALVYAFGGEARLKRAYQEAIERKYFFYSFGDAMLMDKF
ncbi:MAG: tRNA preQ1(34) S-adenosylmethionine ribosyltransferase-isomerase QueA, partial [Thermoplasmatales archaeon]